MSSRHWARRLPGVTFYRESNGVPGLQIGSDFLLGAGAKSGGSWKISTNTHNFAPGQVQYYAVARDVLNNTSAPAEAALTIAAPVVGSLTLAPAALKEGGTVTLTAAERVGGRRRAGLFVQVYLESNGTLGVAGRRRHPCRCHGPGWNPHRAQVDIRRLDGGNGARDVYLLCRRRGCGRHHGISGDRYADDFAAAAGQ